VINLCEGHSLLRGGDGEGGAWRKVRCRESRTEAAWMDCWATAVLTTLRSRLCL